MKRAILLALLVGIVLTQDWIDLEIRADLPLPGTGTWHLNVPLCDLLAALLMVFALPGLVRERPLAPGWKGYLLFLGAAGASVGVALYPQTAVHTLIRKPLFVYLAYGLALSWVVARQSPAGGWRRALVAWMVTTALLSLASSVFRLLAGAALWFVAIDGITPNHKTLAVALAGGLPLVVGLRLTGRWHLLRLAALALAGLAIALSLSKTAWITTALAVALFLPVRRPLGTRLRVAFPALALAIALAVLAPVLVGSEAMLDAARSRHSLDKRAWTMIVENPVLGSGIGMSTELDQVTFPEYRVNGVDAHGVAQKVGGETGALGLLGYGWFALATLGALRRRWLETGEGYRGEAWATVATWGALHCNLLLSTETWSSTHWVPLALAWGISQRSDEP